VKVVSYEEGKIPIERDPHMSAIVIFCLGLTMGKYQRGNNIMVPKPFIEE